VCVCVCVCVFAVQMLLQSHPNHPHANRFSPAYHQNSHPSLLDDLLDYNSVDLQPHHSAAADASELLLEVPGVARDTLAKLLDAGCRLYLM
jgi:hypothetical protein